MRLARWEGDHTNLMFPDDSTQLLAQFLPFRGLSAAGLQAVIQAAQQRRVESNAFFFHQGDPAVAFYVLIQGEVKLTQVTPEGHQVLVRIIGPGEGFGIIAALSDAVHPLTADLTAAEVLAHWPQTIHVFIRHKMACPGCPVTRLETLAEVTAIYGLNLDHFLNKLVQTIQDSGERMSRLWMTN